MTAVAIDADPYLLPMPTSDSPVVLPRWISVDNQHPNARYRDMRWPLAPLIDNPSASLRSIFWKNCPETLRSQVKLTTWIMINGKLRPTQLKSRGATARDRHSPEDLLDTCREWMRLARWLHKSGVADLGACTDDHWRTYTANRWADGIGRQRAEKILGHLMDLWAFDQLSARPAGISQPPWGNEGVDDYLPTAKNAAGGENSTEALDPQVIGPLLVWSIRLVEDFSEDILAAWAEKRRLTALAAVIPATPEGLAAAKDYVLSLARDGGTVPAIPHNGTMVLARTFIAANTGLNPYQVDRVAARYGLKAIAASNPGPCPLQIAVTGQIEGRPWRQHLDFNEAATLMRHLGTAATILCLYLTGMRPQEVQGLRSGCCPDPDLDTDGSPGRHLIYSFHYKNVIDDDGRHVSAGAEREVPWVAIAPVVQAIRVLERMVPAGELLLSATHHDLAAHRGHPGALKGQGMNQRIEDFVTWANREALAQELPDQVIPKDPHGNIGMARFRRTLAWHIARRPGGLIALAIQYGHMRTVLDARTASEYGSRSRHGIHSVLDIETVLAAADTAAHLRDRIASGEKISGPAARRALAAAAQAPRFEGRIVSNTFAKKAARYLARDGLVLFDNPEAHLICVFKRDTALCDPEPDATAPNQPDCRRGCGNAIRTDTHARQLREHAADIEQLAKHAPHPLSDYLLATAARDHAAADIHDTTAQPAEALS